MVCCVFVFTALLTEPDISLSSSASDLFNVKQKRFHLLLGSNFTITCSAQPQFEGGFFQLLFSHSGTVRNSTTPAVNSSAHFLFYAADHTHQGDYTCVYHINAFSHDFTSRSQTLILMMQGSFLSTMLLLLFINELDFSRVYHLKLVFQLL